MPNPSDKKAPSKTAVLKAMADNEAHVEIQGNDGARAQAIAVLRRHFITHLYKIDPKTGAHLMTIKARR